MHKPNPKTKGTASYDRYEAVMHATTTKEYLAMALAHADTSTPSKLADATNKAKADFKYEYDRAWISFPMNESIAQAKLSHTSQESGDKPSSSSDPNITFNHLLINTYVDTALNWIETTNHLESVAREKYEAFVARAPNDMLVSLGPDGAEPANLDPKTHITPNHYKNAIKSKDREHWEEAMEEELRNCNQMNTWELIPQELLPPHAELIDCRWVYKIKTDEFGNIARWRARIVARGFTQRPGLDYLEEEVYAPVVKYDTLRTCLSIAAAKDLEILQADIKSAYLVGHLKEPIYMRQPQSPNMKRDKRGRPLICKLLRPLYGLKQSGHIFANVLHDFLREIGMTSLISDRCAFVRAGSPDQWEAHPSTQVEAAIGTNQLIVATYVDDLTIIGTKAQTEWFMTKLRNRFDIQEKETGDINHILSMGITRDRAAGTLTVNQTAAIERIAAAHGITTEKRCPTPMASTPLTKLETPDPKYAQFPYLNVVGSLLHIAQCTRPDIAYAVGALARHSNSVGAQHIRAANRVVQYLYNTRHMYIQYGTDNNSPNEPTVYESGRSPNMPEAYADADYAMDKATRRSTSGGIIFLNGGPITWSSKLQPIVALSTAEAEIIAATDITKEVVHLKLLLSELGVRNSADPVEIHEDNQACILMGNSMKSSRAAKHYEVRLHYLQQSVNNNTIKFSYCPTEDMVADCLTKPLDEDKFVHFRDIMLKRPDLNSNQN